MELMQLKYFKAVADSGKISTAAEELFVSAPAVSTGISRLEKELGVRLFDRSNNRIELNKHGKLFLKYVNQIFNSLNYAVAELQSASAEKHNSIQIVTTTSNLWSGMLAEYSTENPDMRVSSMTKCVFDLPKADWLNKHAFLFADKNDFDAKDMDSMWLFDDDPVVVVHPSHPFARRESVELQDLQNETLILPIAEQSLNLRIRKLFYDAGIPITVTHEYANMVCEGMVAKNRGVAFSTERTYHLENGLRYIPIRNTNYRWEQRLYWHKDRILSKEEQQFKQFVIRYFGNTVK